MLHFNGFGGTTVDADEIGARGEGAHVELALIAGEGGCEDLGAVVVEDLQIVLAVVEALELDGGREDHGAGIDMDNGHLAAGGECLGADVAFIGGAEVDADAVLAGEAADFLMIGLGVVDLLAVVIPLIGAEAVDAAIKRAAVVDADYIVEDLDEVGVGDVDMEGASDRGGGAVGLVAESDVGGVVALGAIGGNAEEDNGVLLVAGSPADVAKALGDSFVGEGDAVGGRFALSHTIADAHIGALAEALGSGAEELAVVFEVGELGGEDDGTLVGADGGAVVVGIVGCLGTGNEEAAADNFIVAHLGAVVGCGSIDGDGVEGEDIAGATGHEDDGIGGAVVFFYELDFRKIPGDLEGLDAGNMVDGVGDGVVPGLGTERVAGDIDGLKGGNVAVAELGGNTVADGVAVKHTGEGAGVGDGTGGGAIIGLGGGDNYAVGIGLTREDVGAEDLGGRRYEVGDLGGAGADEVVGDLNGTVCASVDIEEAHQAGGEHVAGVDSGEGVKEAEVLDGARGHAVVGLGSHLDAGDGE